MKIYINKDSKYLNPIKYTLDLIEAFSKDTFQIINDKNSCDLIIDHTDVNSAPIAYLFYDNINSNNLNHIEVFKNNNIILDQHNKPDYLTTIFYIVNCLQEYNTSESQADIYGRFKYEKSWQHKFNKIEENVVLQYIFDFLKSIKADIKPSFKSKIFVSHDIDTINGSLLQDGLWALKHRRFDIICLLIFKEIINKGEWKNIDKIIKLESEYDIKSTFFWLVKKGEGLNNIRNADYNISKQNKFIKEIKINSFYFGLHKSCSNNTIDEELSLLPDISTLNRHHFLRFSLPKLFEEIEESKLTFDSSIGFAERYGFRNGFGMPFIPFNLKDNKKYSFVEMPLMVMDGTFQKYLKTPLEKTADTAINFFEKHNQNAYLSFLWHNTHFTNYKYKGYKEEFIKIIKYLYESNYAFITPTEITSKFFKQ